MPSRSLHPALRLFCAPEGRTSRSHNGVIIEHIWLKAALSFRSRARQLRTMVRPQGISFYSQIIDPHKFVLATKLARRYISAHVNLQRTGKSLTLATRPSG